MFGYYSRTFGQVVSTLVQTERDLGRKQPYNPASVEEAEVRMILCILEMALKGIKPDGRFHSGEATLWRAFREVLKANNMLPPDTGMKYLYEFADTNN